MKHRILFVASHTMSVSAFLLPHIKTLVSIAEVGVVVNVDQTSSIDKLPVNICVHNIPVERKLSPIKDVKAFVALVRVFLKVKPTVVHSITPKAGLLGMLAASLARVPVRVHSFTGQVWVMRTGLTRWLLKAIDKHVAAIATDILVDSPSQRDFLIEQGVVSAERSRVLGAGSICGVKTKRFTPDDSGRTIVRDEFGTASGAVVCMYLGRLNRDKGLLDLASAFTQVANMHPDAELWVVGPDEADCFKQMQVVLGKAVSQVKRVGFTSMPERFMQAADLFCLPSYREGFGSSVIEAGACGVPALVSRIYGLTDAVVEGQTGWMHRAGDVQDLAQQLDYLLTNPAELAVKGKAARQYVQSFFAEEIVTDAMLKFYQERLL